MASPDLKLPLPRRAAGKPPVDYITLSGPDFDAAVSGRWTDDGVVSRWMESPRLKYYYPCGIMMVEDERTFFLAVVSPAPTRRVPQPLKQAIGVLELQVNPNDSAEVWLKYITVDPQRQREGVAKRLLDQMVSHLKAHPRLLARSRPSEEGREKIQAYITSLLDSQGLRWTQGAA